MLIDKTRHWHWCTSAGFKALSTREVSGRGIGRVGQVVGNVRGECDRSIAPALPLQLYLLCRKILEMLKLLLEEMVKFNPHCRRNWLRANDAETSAPKEEGRRVEAVTDSRLRPRWGRKKGVVTVTASEVTSVTITLKRLQVQFKSLYCSAVLVYTVRCGSS